ncbi:MAG: HTH-type transcriptional regulator GltC [Candidatus Celerinatantimonas neptuna]|nr:MAG: HTH-type transcriptional regulator GltC [Candidatus Celerinatantimonas neptuna]
MQELQLRYFQCVARNGSLSAAANELHVAVSAVSRQIHRLEKQLGLQLFERLPRGVKLTEAGKILHAYALRNQLELRNVLAQMRGVTTLHQHRIRIACPEGMAWYFLPKTISEYRKNNSNIRFDLHVVSSSRASEMVKSGQVDLALTFNLSPLMGIKIIASHKAPICALMSSKHSLAKKERLTLSDLKNYPITMTLGPSTIRYLFDISCNLSNISIIPEFCCDSLGAIYTMTEQSSSVIALCGIVSVRERATQDHLIIKPIDDPQLHRRKLQIQVMTDRKLTQPFTDFLHLLQKRLIMHSQLG